jgi:hypothetical protein
MTGKRDDLSEERREYFAKNLRQSICLTETYEVMGIVT